MLAINYNGYHDGIARTGWKMKPLATRGERGNLLSVKILTLKICTLPATRENHGIAKH